jgi:hypothetical protein
VTNGSRRWRNLGTAAGSAAAVLFAAFDLYQWAVAYAADRFHNDFTFYLAAARIGLAHGWPSIYDLGLQQAELDALGSGIKIAELARYISPPPVAWLAVPFTALPYELAYGIWSALLLAALVLVWWLAAPGSGPVRLVFLAAAIGWLPVIYGLQLGQPGLFVALAVAGSYALLRADRPVLAGLALGGAALKPQLAFLVPLALLVARRDRAFLGSVAGLGVLAIASAIALGSSGISAYEARIGFASGVPVNRELTLAYFFGASTFTRAVQLTIGLWALFLVYRLRRRGPEWIYACALAGGMLATPYAHLDDLFMLGLAGWLCLRAGAPSWTWLYAFAMTVVIEGTAIWGPAPVLLGELGFLGLLSVATLKHHDRDAEQDRAKAEHDRGLERDREHLAVDRQPEAVDVRQA